MHLHVTVDVDAGSFPLLTDDPRKILNVPARITIETAAGCSNAPDDPLPWDAEFVVSRGDEDDSHTIERLTLTRRPGGEPVTAAGLRQLPLAQIVHRGLQSVTSLGTVKAIHADGTLDLVLDGEQFGEVSNIEIRRARSPRRRNAVSSTIAIDALELYESAKKDRRPRALDWVADQLGVSRSTAHSYVKAGRAAKEEL